MVSLFSIREARFLTDGNLVVDTWWDIRTRSYITQLKDSNGCQIGEAEYTGHRSSAEFAHYSAVKQHLTLP